MEEKTSENIFEIWSGTSNNYHESRPFPPKIILEIILSWLNRQPDVVVDVVCGTGLSTVIWGDIANKVIGVEPNNDMRATADENNHYANISFIEGLSSNTGLSSDSADIITISQAFHWMDIESTLHELYRVLKTGGVMAIYDFALPPVVGWKLEDTFLRFREKCSAITYTKEVPPVNPDKNVYYERIKEFGKFRCLREAECHSKEKWPPQKPIGFLLNISNAEFALRINDGVKTDIERFVNFVSENYEHENVIFPYKILLAVK
jgi:SAM-dependent methyltransferase